MLKPLQISQEDQDIYKKLNFAKLAYMIVEIQGDGFEKGVVTASGPHPVNYDEIIQLLPKDESRYLFLNFQFTSDDKRKISKTVLILWTPNEAPSKNKFLYCTSKNSIKAVFQAVQFEIQSDGYKDVTSETIKNKIMQGEK